MASVRQTSAACCCPDPGESVWRGCSWSRVLCSVWFGFASFCLMGALLCSMNGYVLLACVSSAPVRCCGFHALPLAWLRFLVLARVDPTGGGSGHRRQLRRPGVGDCICQTQGLAAEHGVRIASSSSCASTSQPTGITHLWPFPVSATADWQAGDLSSRSGSESCPLLWATDPSRQPAFPQSRCLSAFSPSQPCARRLRFRHHSQPCPLCGTRWNVRLVFGLHPLRSLTRITDGQPFSRDCLTKPGGRQPSIGHSPCAPARCKFPRRLSNTRSHSDFQASGSFVLLRCQATRMAHHVERPHHEAISPLPVHCGLKRFSPVRWPFYRWTHSLV